MPWKPWSEAGLKERVQKRAREIGKSLADVLAEAGMGHDTLDRAAPVGRRVDTLDKLARGLDWSLAEVMGFEVFGRTDPGLLKEAFEIAQRVLRNHPAARDDDLFFLTASVLDTLTARKRDGDDIESIKAAVEDAFTRSWSPPPQSGPQPDPKTDGRPSSPTTPARAR